MNQLRSFNSLNNLHRELSRVFDSRYPFEPLQTTENNWQPQVDITETENAYKVHAEIPGVSPQDVDVTLHNGILTVKAKRQQAMNTNKVKRNIENAPTDHSQDNSLCLKPPMRMVLKRRQLTVF